MIQKKAPGPLAARLKSTTLGELGARLPIGVPNPMDGSLQKDMSAMAWKTKHERAIGQLRSDNMNFAQYATLVISQLFTRIGPHEFTAETKQAEKQLKIGQMYMPDILYMYIWLRTQVISPILEMNMVCGVSNCRDKFRFKGDLNSLEVHTLDKLADMDWYYTLQDPITIRNTVIKKFRVNITKWYQLETSIVQGFNDSTAKIAIARSSVVGFNDDPELTQLMDSEMDEISKRDLESLTSKIDQDFIGPKMTLEGACPKCNVSFNSAVNWRDNDFFSESSR